MTLQYDLEIDSERSIFSLKVSLQLSVFYCSTIPSQEDLETLTGAPQSLQKLIYKGKVRLSPTQCRS